MNQSQQSDHIHIEGGTYVASDVNTGGGNFIGRDFIQHLQQHVTITGSGNVVGDGNAVIQYHGTVYIIQIGAREGHFSREALQRILTTDPGADIPLRVQANPYCGLAAFTEANAAYFFGRAKLLAKMLTHLRQAPYFLAVVGPSGSGKSSVVQAGLLPALRRGAFTGSQNWQIVTFRPGDDPYAALHATELPFIQGDSDSPQTPFNLQLATFHTSRLLLFIDQFEELFALCPPDVQRCFLDDLHALITGPSLVTVILTLRADFYGHLQRSPLGATLKRSLVDVLPMTAEELRAVVEEPARCVGLTFETGLVERIVIDAGQSEHTLPLLQSALAQMCHQQEDGRLTCAAYQSVGGVAGALGLWAEDTYAAFSAEEQALARCIFTRLVHFSVGEGTDTCQRRTLDELLAHPEGHEIVHHLVRRLADARLLITAESDGAQTVEIIHDALLHEWGRLANWLTEQHEFYLWRQRLDTQLQTWEAQQRAEDALLRGALLAEAIRWQQTYPDDLNLEECAFIQAGQEAEARRDAEKKARHQRELEQAHALVEEQRKRAVEQGCFTRRLRVALAVAVVFLVAAVGGLLYANYQANRVQEALTSEQIARDEADAARDLAERRAGELAVALEIKESARAAAEAAQLKAERQTRISRAHELAAHALAADDLTGSLNLMLAREAVLTTWFTDTVVITRSFVTNETFTTLNSVVFKVQRLPWQMTIPWRMRHTAGVASVAYSPDGTRIVSGSYDQTVRVWDAQSGVELHQLVGHTDEVMSVAYSPDGTQIVSGSTDQTIRVWDAQSGTELYQLTGHAGPVWSVAYSPNGMQIVSGGYDQTVRVWDLQSRTELYHLTGHTGGVRSVAYNPGGARIVSGSDDQTVRVWDAQSGDEMYKLVGHTASVWSVAYSPDGTRIISGSWDDTVRIWDTQRRKELHQWIVCTGGVNAVAYSPDGTRIVSGSNDQTVRVWDAESGTKLHQWTRHTWGVNAVAYSPDGTRIVSGSYDQTVRVWDAQSGVELHQLFGHTWSVTAVAYSPDGTQIVSGSTDQTIRVWDAESGVELHQLVGHTSGVTAVAYSPDGTRIVSGSWDDTVRVWDALHVVGQPHLFRHTGRIMSVAYSPNGKRIVSGSSDQTVRVWDVEGGVELRQLFGHTGWIRAVAYSPDGTRIVSGSEDGTVRVWDAKSGSELRQLIGHTGWVTAVAYSPDGTRIVSGSEDGTVRVWDAKSGSELRQLIGHTGWVTAVAYSSDGTRIASGSFDGSVRVWDAQSGVELYQWAGYEDTGEIISVAYSPDSKRIVSGSVDHTVRVWDSQSGAELHRFIGHTGDVTTVAYSPDGKRIISGSVDHTVRVWDALHGSELYKLGGHTDEVWSVAYSPDGMRIASGGMDRTVQVWYVDVEYLLQLSDSLIQRDPPIFVGGERTLYGFDVWPAREH